MLETKLFWVFSPRASGWFADEGSEPQRTTTLAARKRARIARIVDGLKKGSCLVGNGRKRQADLALFSSLI